MQVRKVMPLACGIITAFIDLLDLELDFPMIDSPQNLGE